MTKLVSLLIICFTPFLSFSQIDIIQNIDSRNVQNLDGRWHYIIDPYETGGNNFFKNKTQQSKSELIEYDFAKSPTMNVPGEWNSQEEKSLCYEGTIWYEHDFEINLQAGKKYFICFKSALTGGTMGALPLMYCL
ncbi:MAG: hypothetical protein ABI683_15365 [Ginsengibacter sp.]